MSIKLNNQTISGLYESQIIPQADTVNSGIIRIATQKEVDDGTDNTTAVTPLYLKQNVAENVKADGVTIVKNDDDSLTTIGQKSINNIIIVDWIGTKEEYELSWNDGTITPNTVCFITDDEEEANVEGLLFIPHSERVENGIIISWTNNQGYDNPDPVLIPFVENNVPLGGTTGQILAKKSDSDYILEWIDNDYSLFKNKPQINNIELIGNKTLDELNIQIKGDYATNTQLDEGLDTKANISDLSDVATSGNYNDLENKPLIPSKTSDLVNDSGFINSIPDEYITEEELNSKGYITEIPDTVQLKLDNTLNTTSKTVVGGINELVNKKVDKEDGKSLISDTEIVRLSGVTNYDDAQIKEDINNLQSNSANIDLSNISQDGINKIKELSEGGSTAIVDVDGITIHNNSDNKLEVIGEKTKNNIAKYTWIGTKEEYNTDLTNGIITSDTECIITDDEENFIVEVDAYTRKEIDVKTENLLNKDLSNISQSGLDVIKQNSGSSLPIGSTIVLDKVLSFEESQGLALQGTYVYKTAVAGERYGYPDFYNEYVDYKNNATATQTTLGSSTITIYNNANGLKFYNIADKGVVDTFFNSTGVADYYGVDEANERIFLPRNNKFWQFTTNTGEVNNYIEAGLPNISGTVGILPTQGYTGTTGAFYVTNQKGASTNAQSGTANNLTGFDASRSNSIYGNSDTVQPASSKKLLYYVVGNTVSDTSWIDVVTQVNGGVKDLEDKTQEGIERLNAIDALKTTQITNCITEIPQDIKLELNDGVLTLKAGSKVYVPNGFEADGTTPKFDEVVIESDATGGFTGYTFSAFVSYKVQTGTLVIDTVGTDPSATGNFIYYNTAENLVQVAGTAGDLSQLSFPIGRVSMDSTIGVKSINQTFNGFGYIGSTVFVLPNVKGLIPNGRNEDGSLRNIEFTVDKVLVNNKQSDWTQTQIQLIRQDSLDGLADYDCYYNQQRNLVLRKETNIEMNACIWGIADLTNGVISNFIPKLPFCAVGYSDSSTVSGWGMPSGKYINIAIGASGTTYTAPANGWLCAKAVSTSSGQELTFTGRTFSTSRSTGAGQNLFACVPVAKNSTTDLWYGNVTMEFFRFVYAEGEA